MIHRFNSFFGVMILFAILLSCKNQTDTTRNTTNYNSKEFQDKLIEANKMYVTKENDEIDQYVVRKKWKMKTSGTGLRYILITDSDGLEAKAGQMASVNYKISLLDGTLCYTSDKEGAKSFLIEQDNVESGLHEGIQHLSVGDKAIFVIPSYLAHGLIGDENKIPAKASVIYEIELLSLN